MSALRLIPTTALLALSLSCSTVAPKTISKPRDLFNGKDFSGWEAYLVDPSVKLQDVWSVKDGLLICKGEPLGYIHTKEKFTTDFKLVVEWRWAPGKKPGNSGVLLRINGEPRGIPRCIEAQLKSGNAGDLYGFHGMKIDGDPARTSRKSGGDKLGEFVAVKRILTNENPPGEWNRYEILARGANLTVFVNGKKVNEAVDCDVVAGPIGLQSEGAEIHFRTVRIEPLPE